MLPRHPDDESVGRGPTGAARAADRDALNAHLATLWAAGRSVAAPLTAYASELPAGRERREVRRLIRRLEADKPPTVSPLGGEISYDLISLLSAGSTDQGMGPQLVDFLQLSHQRANVSRRVAAAAAYPLVLLLIALAIFLICTTFLAPVYRSIYADFGVSLPTLTRLFLHISDVLRATWGLVVLLPLAGAVLTVWLYRRLVPKQAREYLLDWVPLIGRVLRFSGLTNFTSCLSGLIGAGVPTAAALRLAGRGSRQARIAQAADRVASQMESGQAAVQLEGLPPRIPATVVHTLQTQSSPAVTAHALRELAGTYDIRAQEPLQWIGGFFEPWFVILVGGLIGWLFLGLYLPLTQLLYGLS